MSRLEPPAAETRGERVPAIFQLALRVTRMGVRSPPGESEGSLQWTNLFVKTYFIVHWIVDFSSALSGFQATKTWQVNAVYLLPFPGVK
jgi:hypothetical protein